MPAKLDAFQRRQPAIRQQPLRELPRNRLSVRISPRLSVVRGGRDGRIRAGDDAQPSQVLQALQAWPHLSNQTL